MKRWRVTFEKITGCQTDPWLEISSFEVDAQTKADAVRTGLETMRVASTRDNWDKIEVRALVETSQ